MAVKHKVNKNVDTGLLEELGWTPMKWWARRNRARFIFTFLFIMIALLSGFLIMAWFGKLTMDNQPLLISIAVVDVLLIYICKQVFPHVTNPWKSNSKKMKESPFTGKKEIIKQQELIRQEREQLVNDARDRKMTYIQMQKAMRPSLYKQNDIDENYQVEDIGEEYED